MAAPYGSRFGWMTPRARAWREMLKQAVIVLRYKGAAITEENIKAALGPKWAWKMGKLFESVQFVVEDRQAEGVRAAIEEHNAKVEARWRSRGGDPARSSWWHITEITLDHLRPSPTWEKQMAELQLAKECEAEIRKRKKALARRKREQAEQQERLAEEERGQERPCAEWPRSASPCEGCGGRYGWVWNRSGMTGCGGRDSLMLTET